MYACVWLGELVQFEWIKLKNQNQTLSILSIFHHIYVYLRVFDTVLHVLSHWNQEIVILFFDLNLLFIKILNNFTDVIFNWKWRERKRCFHWGSWLCCFYHFTFQEGNWALKPYNIYKLKSLSLLDIQDSSTNIYLYKQP